MSKDRPTWTPPENGWGVFQDIYEETHRYYTRLYLTYNTVSPWNFHELTNWVNHVTQLDMIDYIEQLGYEVVLEQ